MTKGESLAAAVAELGYDVMVMEDDSVTLAEDVWTPVDDNTYAHEVVWDRFCEIQQDLRAHGFQLVGEQLEHDYITATVVYL